MRAVAIRCGRWLSDAGGGPVAIKCGRWLIFVTEVDKPTDSIESERRYSAKMPRWNVENIVFTMKISKEKKINIYQ